MYEERQILENILTEINYLIEKTEELLPAEKTEGSMTMKVTNSNIYYYNVIKTNGVREVSYLGRPDDPEVLRRKRYRFLQERHKVLLHNREVIQNALSELKDHSPWAIHQALPSAYKDLPNQMYEDERFEELNTWGQELYEKNSYPYPENATLSCDGTKMRSKGECIWFDNLKFSETPFRYDEVLDMVDFEGNLVSVSPDFTVPKYDLTRICIEHLGLLHDPSYLKRFASKLLTYYLNGYTLGDNLLVTCDNKDGETNSLAITQIIELLKKKLDV